MQGTYRSSLAPHGEPWRRPMARWPRRRWTTVFTYGTILVLFPLLCWLAYKFVREGF